MLARGHFRSFGVPQYSSYKNEKICKAIIYKLLNRAELVATHPAYTLTQMIWQTMRGHAFNAGKYDSLHDFHQTHYIEKKCQKHLDILRLGHNNELTFLGANADRSCYQKYSYYAQSIKESNFKDLHKWLISFFEL